MHVLRNAGYLEMSKIGRRFNEQDFMGETLTFISGDSMQHQNSKWASHISLNVEMDNPYPVGQGQQLPRGQAED